MLNRAYTQALQKDGWKLLTITSLPSGKLYEEQFFALIQDYNSTEKLVLEARVYVSLVQDSCTRATFTAESLQLGGPKINYTVNVPTYARFKIEEDLFVKLLAQVKGFKI